MLHDLGPRIVIITSTTIKLDDNIIQLFGSKLDRLAGTQIRIKMDIPKLEDPKQKTWTGTGDLLASMLMAHITEKPEEFPKAVEKAVNILRGVLLNSINNPMLGTNEI